MDVQFYGANCLVITGKQLRMVIDDNLAELGAKTVSREGDVGIFTTATGTHTPGAKLVIDQPGEYEVSGVSVYGIPARAHTDVEGVKSATMYKIVLEDTRILIVGHIYPELSDAQQEAIGMIDIMFVPVGGNGYTLDGVGALKLVKKVDPKVVVPMHYDDPSLRFPVPQHDLAEAIKALAMEPKEHVSRFKLKSSELADVMQLIVLEKS